MFFAPEKKTMFISLFTGPPGAPREPFEASSVGYTEVCLTWLPPNYSGGSPISSYVLEWKENGSEDWTSTEIPVNVHSDRVYVPANTLEEIPLEPMVEKITYTVTGLTDGTTYSIRMRAKNEQGVSKPLLMKGKISTKEFKGTYINYFSSHELRSLYVIIRHCLPQL